MHMLVIHFGDAREMYDDYTKLVTPFKTQEEAIEELVDYTNSEGLFGDNEDDVPTELSVDTFYECVNLLRTVGQDANIHEIKFGQSIYLP